MYIHFLAFHPAKNHLLSVVFLTIFLLQPVQQELPKEKWYCCGDCNKIHTALQKLIVCGSEALPNSLLDGIRQKYRGNNLSNSSDLDVRWRLLSGNITCSDSRLLLSKAVDIFHVSICMLNLES